YVVPFKADNRKERNIAGGYVKEPHIGKHKWVISFDFRSLYPHLAMTFNISPDTYLGTIKDIFGENSVGKIMESNLDSYQDIIRKQDVTITGCGTVYTRKKKGFIPAIMESLFAKRAEHQKLEDEYTKKYAATNDKHAEMMAQVYESKSTAIKYLLNGGYGALSNEFYRFFHDNIAESFTLSGQLAIKTVEKFVNERANKLLETNDVDYVCAI